MKKSRWKQDTPEEQAVVLVASARGWLQNLQSGRSSVEEAGEHIYDMLDDLLTLTQVHMVPEWSEPPDIGFFKSIGLNGDGHMTYLDKLGHNSTYFNGAGQKVAWGDLDVPYLDALLKELPHNQPLLVLPETPGSSVRMGAFVDVPFLVGNARYLLLNNVAYVVGEEPGPRGEIVRCGFAFRTISRERLTRRLLPFVDGDAQ